MYALCQVEKPIIKGNSIISGGGTIEYSKYESGIYNGSTRTITFNPGFGYFFIDNLVLGLNTTIGYEKTSVKYTTYGIGPFAKYYFNNGVFIKTETFYSTTKAVGSSTHKTTSLSMAPGVGYAFFLNSRVSLEPSLNYRYNHYTSDISDSMKTNDIFFELKLNIFL